MLLYQEADWHADSVEYIRVEAAVDNSRGIRTGIFGLANGLAHSKALSDEEWSWWRANNDWYNDAYANPASIDANLFNNPTATCWFKASALHLLDRVPGYLALLDRHSVAWAELRSQNPGQIIYDDDVQIVVIPIPQEKRLTDDFASCRSCDVPAKLMR